MSTTNLSKEEQQKLNQSIKEKFGDEKKINKPAFSMENLKKTSNYREDPLYDYSSNDYFDEDYDDREFRNIQLDFKTIRELFNKEQQLYKLEEKSKYQTLDISNLTLKVTELEEKISEIEEENTNQKQSLDYIESVIKFNNKDINEFKTRNSNNLVDIQNNITDIEIAFRKVEKEYNDLLKSNNDIESVELKRYLNSLLTIKYHSILEVYNKRYKTIDTINIQRDIISMLSVLFVLASVLFTLFNSK